MTEVVIPERVEEIPAEAFSLCAGLRKVTFKGDTLKRLATRCFESCMMEEFRAPQGLREVEYGAFFDCKRLRDVVLNEGLTTLGKCEHKSAYDSRGMFKGSEVQYVTLPSTLRILGDDVFRNCESLRRVTFRDDSCLELIGNNCFSACGIEEIAIPSGVVTIGSGAF